MALPRALIRVLGFAAALSLVALLYNLAFTPAADGAWDASSWADRRTANSPYRTEQNPNGVVYDSPSNNNNNNASPPSKWNLFGGLTSPRNRNPPKPPSYTTPRPLPRVNTTRARENFGRSRVVIPNSSPEAFEEGPLPGLEDAFAHLEPMLRAVKERHQNIPREHALWQPIFPPFLTDDMQERYWHLREEWDDQEKVWKHGGERRFMLVTVCRQVAGESGLVGQRVKTRLTATRYAGGLVRYLDCIGGFPGARDITLLVARGRLRGRKVCRSDLILRSWLI
jgi:alpha-1,3-mannosyltransferase